MLMVLFFFKQKTAYEMRISDWSSDVCSSDLPFHPEFRGPRRRIVGQHGEGVCERRLGGRIGRHVVGRPALQPRQPVIEAAVDGNEHGRSSCRERVWQYV